MSCWSSATARPPNLWYVSRLGPGDRCSAPGSNRPPPAKWRKEKIFAYAGIGRPQKFYDSLTAVGATVVRTRSYPDHHVYTGAEADELLASAAVEQHRLVTTEKDAVRFARATGSLARLRERTDVFAVTLAFDNPAAVAAMLTEAVRKARGR